MNLPPPHPAEPEPVRSALGTDRSLGTARPARSAPSAAHAKGSTPAGLANGKNLASLRAHHGPNATNARNGRNAATAVEKTAWSVREPEPGRPSARAAAGRRSPAATVAAPGSSWLACRAPRTAITATGETPSSFATASGAAGTRNYAVTAGAIAAPPTAKLPSSSQRNCSHRRPRPAACTTHSWPLTDQPCCWRSKERSPCLCSGRFSHPRTPSRTPPWTPWAQIRQPGPSGQCWLNTGFSPHGITIWPDSRRGSTQPLPTYSTLPNALPSFASPDGGTCANCANAQPRFLRPPPRQGAGNCGSSWNCLPGLGSTDGYSRL